MRIKTHFKTPFVSLVSLVQSGHVTPFFASTESQESKSDISLCNRTRQCALRPILRPLLYLWCPLSNLDMLHHFLHLHNLRNPNLISFVQQNAAMRTKAHFKTPFVSLESLKSTFKACDCTLVLYDCTLVLYDCMMYSLTS